MHYFYRFLEWFDTHARFFVLSWPIIVIYGGVVEIIGAIRRNGTTFTAFCRSLLVISGPWYLSWAWYVRATIIGVLFWHFCIAKANFQK